MIDVQIQMDVVRERCIISQVDFSQNYLYIPEHVVSGILQTYKENFGNLQSLEIMAKVHC